MANHLSAAQAIQHGRVHTAILAGGFGQRLDATTDPTRNIYAVAKPACTVGNLRIIEFTIRALRRAGISDFHLLLCVLPDTIRQVVGNGKIYGMDVNITESTQDISDPLDTASVVGNLVHNRGWEKNDGDIILVPSADIIHNNDIGAIIERHLFNRERHGACATIVPNIVPWNTVEDFGTIRLEGMPERKDFKTDNEFEDAVGAWSVNNAAASAKIIEFKEKVNRDAALSNLNNSSLYVFDAALFRQLLPMFTRDDKGAPLFPELFQPGGPIPFSDWGKHVFKWLTQEPQQSRFPIYTYVMSPLEYWRDARIGEEILLANMDLLKGLVDSGLKEGEGTFWNRTWMNSWRGYNVFIHPSAKISNSIIGDNATIGEGVELDNVVAGSNTNIGPGVILKRTVIFHQRDPKVPTTIGRDSKIVDSLILGGSNVLPGSEFNGRMIHAPYGGVSIGSLGGKTEFKHDVKK